MVGQEMMGKEGCVGRSSQQCLLLDAQGLNWHHVVVVSK